MTTDDYQAWWAQIDLCDNEVDLALVRVALHHLEQDADYLYNPAFPNGWDPQPGLLLDHAQARLDRLHILHFSEDIRGTHAQ